MPRACARARRRTTGFRNGPRRGCFDAFGKRAWHIPRRGQKPEPKPDGAKARRWVVERTHSWLNRYRRLLVRWEKKAAKDEAMLHLAAGIIAFQQAGLFG